MSRTPKAFRVIVADPPWRASDKLPGKGRGAAKHYETMSIAEICAFPLPPICRDAVLLLWRVAWMPGEAVAVARAWGFEPKSEIVWAKIKDGFGAGALDVVGEAALAFGMGRYVRMTHETCMIAARGSGPSVAVARNTRSVFSAPLGAHSEKPREFYELVESTFAGPFAEIFARRPRAGWTQWGNQLPGRPAAPRRIR